MPEPRKEDPSDPPTQTGTAQRDFSQPDPSRGEGSMDAARSYSMNQSSSPATEASTREDRFGEAGLYMKDGGLAAKKKPKPKKKMKRGGLASKK